MLVALVLSSSVPLSNPFLDRASIWSGDDRNHSVSSGLAGSGGAIDATFCTIVLENTMFAENTAAGDGAHGGAAHLGLSSALVAKASTAFIGNTCRRKRRFWWSDCVRSVPERRP